METYKILGIIGLIIVGILTIIISLFALVTPYYFPYGMMGYYGNHYMMFGYSFMMFPLVFFIITAVLALIGLAINDKIAAGILLILASFFSLPLFFGGFGIGFILLLLAGIFALINK
ncbi:hypothetical protein Calag_0065 [Caldisphaera lagunensis DSM 15908]|uniref:DUF4064 domain-containing protein n=1 Tax=Caldisphaera lagunensis (strain DSM 15908 / JCM 11604 / ANMR 0165 / IC-154) TaxID=1056495 RepID=L0A7Q5_CALLD|nr:hypothetical protein [Caldisphaera lagunensis]AFZ69856.1 hypothetical protein Calag_0065 [Caldisphaera lagunensis DSM 15908]